jgi:hypothetical protein
LEELLDDSHGIIRTVYGMSNSSHVLINLVFIATLEHLVTEKVNSIVFNTIGKLGVGFDMTKTVGLVPACRENITRDLSTYGVTGRLG